MKLYNIIKLLQTTQGSKAKQAILDDNWNNELLREYMKAVLDPAINYYISKIPKYKKALPHGGASLIEGRLKDLDKLSNRLITGKIGIQYLTELFNRDSFEGQELLTHIIKRKIADANVGETMVLKTWPELFFIAPYQRCSLLDAKTKAEFDKLDHFVIQTKCDGAFAYGICTNEKEVMTRAGSVYPEWFANRLLIGAGGDIVFVGELLVYEGDDLQDRQTGNGILNSILQGTDEKEFKQYIFKMIAWDLLPYDDWSLGACDEPYCDRLGKLEILLEKEGIAVAKDIPNIELVYYETVTSMQQAFSIYQDHLERGEEGCIIKHPLALWKDGTSKQMVKLKLKFQADYVITGYYEGTGKAEGMLGGIEVETSDGLLRTDCGSGFDDATRKNLWAIRDQLPGQIVTIEANDVGTKRNSRLKSLFLPIFIEIRQDKTEADSLERVVEQLEAAKRGELK